VSVAIQRVHAGGATDGTIALQHAVVDEDDAYVTLGTPVSCAGAATTDVQCGLSFLGFVRWVTDANVNGQPLMAIEIIAREH